jgi:hypothetical protein
VKPRRPIDWKQAAIGFAIGVLLMALRQPFVEFMAHLAVDRGWSITEALWILVAVLAGSMLFVAAAWFLIARIFR